jgi:hypothetical protein
MSRLVILGMLFSLGSIFSQSLGKDRIKQIDKTVVRITIDSRLIFGYGLSIAAVIAFIYLIFTML